MEGNTTQNPFIEIYGKDHPRTQEYQRWFDAGRADALSGKGLFIAANPRNVNAYLDGARSVEKE